MMESPEERLRTALALTHSSLKPTALAASMRRDWKQTATDALSAFNAAPADASLDVLPGLQTAGVDATFLGSPSYPHQLYRSAKAPAFLFFRGNHDLFKSRSIGMCGSRHVSEAGMKAAQGCGEEVASHGLVVSSGYAKGVDTETHLAALRTGGDTVVVLAEGITHFRMKRSFKEARFDWNNMLVVSQFHPNMRWSVGNAMTRNAVIVGLGKALVVIEAGEKGGTLNAGLQAIQAGRPVLALEFESQPTPAGNLHLIERGALAIKSRGDLARTLERISTAPPEDDVSAEQLALI